MRDNANVPHIFGQTDTDVFFALGYAHAQDRLWQMMMLRRTVQGRLSELFGPRTLEIDRLLRHLDLYTAAVRSYEDQDAETQAALEAYAAGVNAWLAEVNDGARGRGAPEMWLFNHPVAPWTPADSIAILKLLALQLNAQLPAEVLRARVSLVLPAGAGRRHPARCAPGDGMAALPRYAALVHDVPRYASAAPDRRLDPLVAAAARLRRRLERLGRGAVALGRRLDPAGQRPASGADRAVDLVSRPAGTVGRRRHRRHDPRHPADPDRRGRPTSAGASPRATSTTSTSTSRR